MEKRLTIQIHADGQWRDAAEIGFRDPGRGIRGSVWLSYRDDYYFDLDIFDEPEGSVVDRRAMSVRHPVDLEYRILDRWPAWLLDLLPQGAARRRIADELGLRLDAAALDIGLLMRAGGAPIGNIRIKEAWEEEQQRLKGVVCPPLSDGDVRTRSDLFLEVVGTYAHLASGSSGVQGEWPKALLTRSVKDGMWYPDPFVDTDEGAEHMIVKLLKSTNANDELILESEAPYLELARAFDLNVAAPLGYDAKVLRIPRFDRDVLGGEARLHGQESLVSMLGVSEFGHITSHETYLARLQAVSDDPAADTLEYIRRDLLNLATGNPDNHGHNTALTKPAGGGIRLSPLFDYAPMRLSDAAVMRVTTWECMKGVPPGTGFEPICQAAACEGLDAGQIRDAMLGMLPLLERLDALASDLGVPEPVIAQAFDKGRVAQEILTMDEASPCPS